MSESETPVTVADTPIKRLFISVDGIGGWIAIAVGVMAAAEGLRLGLGTMSRMGPGYFPMAAAVVLLGLGALMLVNAVRKGGPIARVPFGLPVILLLVSLISFGVLLPMIGLAPATIVLMLLAAFAVTGRVGVGDIVFAAVTSVVAVLVFINGLGVVLPAARWPF